MFWEIVLPLKQHNKTVEKDKWKTVKILKSDAGRTPKNTNNIKVPSVLCHLKMAMGS